MATTVETPKRGKFPSGMVLGPDGKPCKVNCILYVITLPLTRFVTGVHRIQSMVRNDEEESNDGTDSSSSGRTGRSWNRRHCRYGFRAAERLSCGRGTTRTTYVDIPTHHRVVLSRPPFTNSKIIDAFSPQLATRPLSLLPLRRRTGNVHEGKFTGQSGRREEYVGTVVVRSS